MDSADSEIGINGKRGAKDAVGAKGVAPGNVVKLLITKFDGLANDIVHNLLPSSGYEHTLPENTGELLAYYDTLD